MSKRRTNAHMSWEDFQKKFPVQAKKLMEDDAKRGRRSDVAPAAPAKGQSSFFAKPTQVLWQDGEVVTLPSKTEARVAERLLKEYPSDQGYTVYRKVRFPLFSIQPRPGGTPHYLEIDFLVVKGNEIVRAVDAKRGKKSKDWARGKAAGDRVLLKLGVRIEETDV